MVGSKILELLLLSGWAWKSSNLIGFYELSKDEFTYLIPKYKYEETPVECLVNALIKRGDGKW